MDKDQGVSVCWGVELWAILYRWAGKASQMLLISEQGLKEARGRAI